MIKKKSEEGSILIELVFTCLLLMLFMLGTVEVINIIRADIYLHKIAREGAREAAISNSVAAGKGMAEDAANQYFNSSSPVISVYTNDVAGETANVVCDVSYTYRNFCYLNKDGIGGLELNAKAIYPWWDENS